MLRFFSSAVIVGVAMVAFLPLSPASCSQDALDPDRSSAILASTKSQPEPAMAANQPDHATIDSWDESATWKYKNAQLKLSWEQPGGDWTDARGVAHGEAPFASALLIDDDKPGPIDIDVSNYFAKTGRADFFVRQHGGTNFVFHSRESTVSGPQLIIDGSRALNAVADASLSSGTVASLGKAPTLTTMEGFLIRFEIPVDRKPTKLVLRLTSTGAEYGNQTIGVFQPGSPAAKIDRPSWLKQDPTVIASFDGNSMLGQRNVRVEQGIATASLQNPELTWMSMNVQMPERNQACATIYHKLHLDFRPGSGGKLPGFANTGNAYPGSDSVNGIVYPDSGWGGRSPDGIHWSARTGYGTWTPEYVSLGTYFYAMEPNNSWGWGDTINAPIPKGRWSAYIQCLKLNSVTAGKAIGNKDGGLYYEIPGAGPVYNRNDIRWRDQDVAQSKIREFWINYYCGGASCGSGLHGTVGFSKVVITEGLPDNRTIQAELDRLNNLPR